MIKVHEVKSEPPFFAEVWSGEKRSEVRFNDRDYQPLDLLLLREYDPENERYPGAAILAVITHVETHVGLIEGYVALTIAPVLAQEEETSNWRVPIPPSFEDPAELEALR